jgi:xylulokinase
MRVLAIDIGSSSVKAGYWDGRRFAARVRIPIATHFDGVKVEASAGLVLRAVEQAGREVLRGEARGGSGVDCIAFCAFSSALVVTDERGVIRAGAITHQDRRSVAEARELCARLEKKWLLEHTGNLPYPGGIGSSTLAWLRRHEPEMLRGHCRVGQLSSLIGWMLTGEWTIDPSQAVFLGLWEIGRAKRGWSERACDAVGVSMESLPRMVRADEVMGFLLPGLARRWGVRAGTPVAGGFVDTSAGVIQTPMAPGQLIHATGSTDVLAMCVAKPSPAEGILSRPVGTGAVFADRWLAVRTIAAAGTALDWARSVLFSQLGDAAWRRMVASCCAETRAEGGVTCVPGFAGERAAIEQIAGASFKNVTLAAGPRDFLKAIVRGLALESVKSYDLLARIATPRTMVYSTGAAKALQRAMHQAWPRRHQHREWTADNLRGLVILARRISETPFSRNAPGPH